MDTTELTHSTCDPSWRATETFAVAISLTNITQDLTIFHRVPGVNSHILGIYLTINPEYYTITISIPIEIPQLGTTTRLIGTVYGNSSLYSLGVEFAFDELTSVIHVGIETVISNSMQKNSNMNRKPWFTRLIQTRQKIRAYRRYLNYPTPGNPLWFVTARNG